MVALALGGIWLHCAAAASPLPHRPERPARRENRHPGCSARLSTAELLAVELGRARHAPPYLVRSTTLGEIYNPAEAVTAGFLDRLVPADEVEATALKVAEDLVPLRYAFNTVKEYERSRCSTAAAAASSTTSRSS